MIYSRTVIAILLCLPGVGFAQSNDGLNDEIDALFAGIDQRTQPGCAAGVVHRGEYIHKAGYGLANLEYGIPITPQSVFRIGSVSKQFTAMAIAILAERGELDLDADVHEYLPDLTEYGHTVTLRQMVHHIAGMGDYDHEALRNPDGSEFRFGNQDFSTIPEFYAKVAQADLVYEPGSRYEYSNLGYFLLSQVVERVSGMTLREFAAVEIFSRLDMNTSFFNDNVNQPVPNRADGYRKTDDGLWEIFMTNLSYVGDGGVYTNLDDFIRWDRNFYRNRLGSGEQSLIETVTTPHPDTIEQTDDGPVNVNYAFGMRVAEANGEFMIGHTGGWVAFSAIYNRYPELEMSVVVFCNSTEVSAPEIGRRIGELAVAAIRQ